MSNKTAITSTTVGPTAQPGVIPATHVPKIVGPRRPPTFSRKPK